MLNNFYKYQSVGNDFIIFDAYHKDKQILNDIISSKKWKPFVIKSCKRHFGVGADGILIISNDEKEKLPELFIYNSDGSKAEICINGLRCIAFHLREYHDFDKKLKIKVSNKIINCQINKNNVIVKVPGAKYNGTKDIKIHEKNILGHLVKIPNQHFVIPQKTTLDWLEKNGKLIESNKRFKGKTNVEFVWPKDPNNNFYNALVYERGVGPTLACGSGAGAICWSLFKSQKIQVNQKVNLIFPGGKIICWIDKNKNISIQANAKLIFKGQIN